MEITAAMVKALRQRTGVGMMECKKSLAEARGDVEHAVELLRKSGRAKADDRGARTAAEGVVVLKQDDGAFVLLEVNCETDFVAKDAQFNDFCDKVARAILEHAPRDVATLSQLDAGGIGVEAARLELISKIGENVQVRRFLRMRPAGSCCGAYRHGSRIGVLVDLEGGDAGLARDLAMHVAATRPVCLGRDDAPAELLARERKILTAQAEDSGKPAGIVAKMVEGRLNKYVREIALLEQPFVKDDEQTVGALLGKHSAAVRAFHRYEVGEGIERDKKENFAAEVMAQARGG